MVIFDGETFDWEEMKDIHGDIAYVLRLVHISIKIARPEVLTEETAKTIVINLDNHYYDDRPSYFLVTLTTLSVPGQAFDLILPSKYATAEEAKTAAEKVILDERTRVRTLFAI